MLFWIVEATAGFIECFISTLFIGDVLGVETRRYKESVILTGMVTAGLLFINRIQLFSALGAVYGIIALTISAYILYRKNLWDTLVAMISYILLLYLIDFFTLSFVGTIMNEDTLGADIISRQSWSRVFFIIITKSELISGYAVFHRFFQKVAISLRKILIGVAVAFGLIFDLQRKLCQRIEGNIIGIGVLLLATIAIGGYLIIQYSEMKKQKLQMELAQERNLVMIRGYEDMMRNYWSNAVYYHDLKNHMLTIERFLINKEYDKADGYMKTIQTAHVEAGAYTYKWTGIEIIDFILNYKKEAAEKKGISFIIDADLLKIEGMEEADLCALFGNLLDNAIEGCEREDGKGEIHISIRRIREMLLIKAVNTCRNTPQYKGGVFFSSKKDKGLHGWGIKSMEMIAEKYGGTIRCEYKNGEFNAVLTFFL